MKIEGESYDRTTTPECSEDRTPMPSVVNTESELCVCAQRVAPLHTHTFEGLQSWVTKPIGQLSHTNPTPQTQHHKPWMELHYSNSCQQFSAFGWPTGSSVLYLSICVPTYTQNTRPHLCMQQSEQDEWGGYHKPLEHTLGSWVTHPQVCYPVCQRPIPEKNTRHYPNNALSRTRETKRHTT